jgi:protein-disulfide isomerase
MTYRELLLALLTLPLLAATPAHAAAAAKGPGAVTTPKSTVGSDEAAGTARAPEATDAPFNVIGSADAPVSIVEFSDLQCPHCANYALHTFPQIKRAYIDTGKVHYAAVDFPLPMHAYAFPAAVAARCAGEQGKYWQYREAIFAGQSQLVSSPGFDVRALLPRDADPFDKLARNLDMDVARFDACRRDVRQDAVVREDLAMARRDGITSTPSFMIGRVVDGELRGETISGAKSFEELAAKIDALLREAR